jgi:benzaldehyde dehydrogenase (NAD)
VNEINVLIGGEHCAATNGARFERRNPLDGAVATRAPAATPADAVRAVDAAARAFESGSTTSKANAARCC